MPDKRDGLSVLEKAVKYGSNVQNAGNQQQNSLFGGACGGADVTEPTVIAGRRMEPA